MWVSRRASTDTVFADPTSRNRANHQPTDEESEFASAISSASYKPPNMGMGMGMGSFMGGGMGSQRQFGESFGGSFFGQPPAEMDGGGSFMQGSFLQGYGGPTAALGRPKPKPKPGRSNSKMSFFGRTSSKMSFMGSERGSDAGSQRWSTSSWLEEGYEPFQTQGRTSARPSTGGARQSGAAAGMGNMHMPPAQPAAPADPLELAKTNLLKRRVMHHAPSLRAMMQQDHREHRGNVTQPLESYRKSLATQGGGAESMNCAELGLHPSALPNLLRASAGDGGDRGSVALPHFKRKQSNSAQVATEVKIGKGGIPPAGSQLSGWHNGRYYDERMSKVAYRYRPPAGVWARVVYTHPAFQRVMICLVVLSSVILAVQVETPPEYWLAHLILERLDAAILACFIAETVLKWMDNFAQYWTDKWNIFDFIITLLAVIPEILSLLPGDERQGNSSSSTVTKLIRQLRVLRALRSFKMVSKFGALKEIVATILETFGSIGNIMLLLFMLMYIYAVVACQIFEEFTMIAESTPGLPAEKFSQLEQAFVSLFQLLTLDQWHSIYDTLLTHSGLPAAVTTVFIVSWVWLGAFIFRNIFVGVIVKGFQKARKDDAAEQDELNEKVNTEACDVKDEAEWLAAAVAWSEAAQPDSARVKALFHCLPTLEAELEANLQLQARERDKQKRAEEAATQAAKSPWLMRKMPSVDREGNGNVEHYRQPPPGKPPMLGKRLAKGGAPGQACAADGPDRSGIERNARGR